MHRKQGCIIAGRSFEQGLCLFKNRDRAYDTELCVVHLEKNGSEIAIVFDPKTGYLEGVNEFGIGIVNTALMVAHDEAEGKGKSKDKGKGKGKGKGKSKDKGPVKSKDGPKILQALLCKTLDEALKILLTDNGGIKGHTFLCDGKTLLSIECSRTHPARVTTLNPKRTNIRTNHGISYPDAGYTEGEDYVSSITRRWEAQKRIQNLRHPEDIGPSLLTPLHDKDSPFNPVRDTEKMRTTSQLLINTSNPSLTLYLIPKHSKLLFTKNALPNERKPKIPVRVIQYESDDSVEELDKKASIQRVASRPLAPLPVLKPRQSLRHRTLRGELEKVTSKLAYILSRRYLNASKKLPKFLALFFQELLKVKGPQLHKSIVQSLADDSYDPGAVLFSLSRMFGSRKLEEMFISFFIRNLNRGLLHPVSNGGVSFFRSNFDFDKGKLSLAIDLMGGSYTHDSTSVDEYSEIYDKISRGFGASDLDIAKNVEDDDDMYYLEYGVHATWKFDPKSVVKLLGPKTQAILKKSSIQRVASRHLSS